MNTIENLLKAANLLRHKGLDSFDGLKVLVGEPTAVAMLVFYERERQFKLPSYSTAELADKKTISVLSEKKIL